MKTNVSVNGINTLDAPEFAKAQERLIHTDGIFLFI